ncbi:Uncharacterized protein HZ326_19855 [Fusarium oxysporum f. sp. albedinis]|nr:Uncharacterized protein HZ326_19855 [Fusarium oxysporum f. sp. albedinis]
MMIWSFIANLSSDSLPSSLEQSAECNTTFMSMCIATYGIIQTSRIAKDSSSQRYVGRPWFSPTSPTDGLGKGGWNIASRYATVPTLKPSFDSE